MTNIIFLDIDGALNSMPYANSIVHTPNEHQEINPFNLQQLSTIYNACNCKIILSSTWRTIDVNDNEDCKNMYAYLKNTLASKQMFIYDKTPVINNNRPLEIKTWLTQHPNVTHFVILDDDFNSDAYAEYQLEKHLVHTNYFCKELKDGGLQNIHVEKAIEILRT